MKPILEQNKGEMQLTFSSELHMKSAAQVARVRPGTCIRCSHSLRNWVRGYTFSNVYKAYDEILSISFLFDFLWFPFFHLKFLSLSKKVGTVLLANVR